MESKHNQNNISDKYVKRVENHYVMGQINLTPGKTPSCELIFGWNDRNSLVR